MAKDQSVEPNDPLGKEIYKDIKSYTSKGEAIPADQKSFNVNARQTKMSPSDYKMWKQQRVGSRKSTKA
jgi:hypothetical protein